MQRTCSSPSALPDPGGIGHATVLHADRQDDTSPPPKQHVKNALCGSCRRGRFSYGGSCALWGVWHISLPLRGRRRAQRGRMRSRQGPNEVASMQPSEPAVSNAGGLRRLLGNSLGFRETLGCRDIPAQGLTPPLHPRKGHHPLTRFRWRDSVELSERAVSNAGGLRRLLGNSGFSLSFSSCALCCAWAAAASPRRG